MIKIFASGNIGQDAEVKVVGEHNVTTFSIASNKKVRGENKTTWLNCKLWNREALAQYLLKGRKIVVTGELEIREYEGKYYTSCIINECELIGDSEEPESRKPKSKNIDDIDGTQDLPF